MKSRSITSSPNPRTFGLARATRIGDFLARATRIGKFLARVTRRADFAPSVVPKHVKPDVVDVGLARHAYLVPSEAALPKMNVVRCAVLISVVPFAVQKEVPAVSVTAVIMTTTVLRVARVILRTSQRILNLSVNPRLKRKHVLISVVPFAVKPAMQPAVSTNAVIIMAMISTARARLRQKNIKSTTLQLLLRH